MISSTDKWQGKDMRARIVFRSKDLKVLLTTDREMGEHGTVTRQWLNLGVMHALTVKSFCLHWTFENCPIKTLGKWIYQASVMCGSCGS